MRNRSLAGRHLGQGNNINSTIITDDSNKIVTVDKSLQNLILKRKYRYIVNILRFKGYGNVIWLYNTEVTIAMEGNLRSHPVPMTVTVKNWLKGRRYVFLASIFLFSHYVIIEKIRGDLQKRTTQKYKISRCKLPVKSLTLKREKPKT